jgi:hypothetical protein
MQELQDRYFDDCIIRALKAEGTVTPQQQRRAWEALRRKTAQQTILPAIAHPMRARVWEIVRVWGKARLVDLYNVILDDSAYRRAQHGYPILTPHRRPHSTFASAEFMLPA